MTWNYRIVKYHDGSGFGLHEVRCDDEGLPASMTERPAGFSCGTEEGAGEVLKAMRAAVRQ